MQEVQSFSTDGSLKNLVASEGRLTPSLLFRAIAKTCPSMPDSRTLPIYNRLRMFAHQEAWLDALVCLIEIRLPRWRLREVFNEDGRWTSVLCLRWFPSQSPNAVCVGQHDTFELSILDAYLQAVERASELEATVANVVPMTLDWATPPIAIYSKAKT